MKTTNLNIFLLIACSTVLVGCNNSDGYKKISEASAIGTSMGTPVQENNILCSEANNLEACIALKDECSIVFEDSEDAEGVRPFAACIPIPKDDLPDDPADEVSVEEYVDEKGKCSELDPKYLLVKGSGQPKVLVCHSSHLSSHTIAVACPALKAHTSHQDGKDFLGACKE
jgi:predicted small secreted protein